MIALNLRQDWRPINWMDNYDCHLIDFPSGIEPHVRIPANMPTDERVVVTARVEDPADFMRVLNMASALGHYGIPTTRTTLFMPFIPHARQDRVAVTGDANSGAVVLNSISAAYGTVIGLDIHGRYFYPAISASPRPFIEKAFLDMNLEFGGPVVAVFPDKGAADRYASLGYSDCIFFEKKRDPETGKIASVDLALGVHYTAGLPCLIIDDICDGGGTFIPISKKLKEMGAKAIGLYTSHGIYSKGLLPLEDHFDRFYTTDSYNGRVQAIGLGTEEGHIFTGWKRCIEHIL